MEKLKELWKKLNPRVALIGGVVVVSTTAGTCHFLGDESAPVEEVKEAEAPAEETEATEKPEAPAEEPAEAPAEE